MVLTPTIEMANLGMADSLILMVLALVVFGPRRLPEIGRQIGKLMYEFRKASNDFKFQMEEELRNAEETDRRKKEEERLRALALAAPAAGTIEAGSQVSESNPHPSDEDLSPGSPRPGAPASVADGESPVTSPYPGEIEYPPVASAVVPDPPAEEPYPRIQPPSTGEPVPAEPPASPATSLDASLEGNVSASPVAIPDPGATPEEAEHTLTDPVNHNG
jgi:sec-independent protein translocase protein TatB